MLAARQAMLRRGAAAPAPAAAASARPSRRPPSSSGPLLVRASAPSSHGGGHSSASPSPGKKSPAPLPAAAAAQKDGPASAVSTTAAPPQPPLTGEAPSLFGMLSSLWPVGGAASKAKQEAEVARRPPLARPMASRLELEAELAACEAEGAPPLVVVFSTAWCGPCRLFAEDLEKVAAARGGPVGVRIVKVDVEQKEGGLAELASALGVNKLPTAMFCGRKGASAPAVRTQGLLRRAVLEDLIDNRAAFLGSNLDKAVTY